MTYREECDPVQLEKLFHETLPDAVANDMADHVADCPACQRELELLAAGQNWWVEASQRLSQSSAEVPSLRINRIDGRFTDDDRRSEGLTNGSRSGDLDARFDDGGFFEDGSPDEVYASDFAVDFLEPSDDPAVLGRLGEYEIVEVIGRGGMGVVLKGFQKELHRFVAVKVLAPHLATSGAARRRFAREAQATAAVVNPHVMAIHSVHASSKLPYLVMPFVHCQSLQQRLDHEGPLNLKDILRIGMQAALGLAAAHAQGLVHRDVKPANILLETNVDRVMLTDFGLARAVDDATLTRTGIIAGTPQYMSPEQANGDAVDHRSDLFSLGSVLYAMCTARPPFRAETTFGVLRRIRETDPRPVREINADIPEWFERIVMRLLSKNPATRIPTAKETAGLLEQCLAHVQQPTVVSLPVAWRESAIPFQKQVQKQDPIQMPSWKRGMWMIPAVILIAAATWWSRLPPRFNDQPSSGAVTGHFTNQDKTQNVAPETVESRSDPIFDWDQTQKGFDDAIGALEQLEIQVQFEKGNESTRTDQKE